MTMDPTIGNLGNFTRADVLIEGKKILDVRPKSTLATPGRSTPAARSSCPDSSTRIITSSRPHCGASSPTGSCSRRQPHGVDQLLPVHSAHIRARVPAEGCVHQRAIRLAQPARRGVTTCHDISQIHHTPQHSDAAIQGSADSGRRIAFGYFESATMICWAFRATSTRRTRGASKSSSSPPTTSS